MNISKSSPTGTLTLKGAAGEPNIPQITAITNGVPIPTMTFKKIPCPVLNPQYPSEVNAQISSIKRKPKLIDFNVFRQKSPSSRNAKGVAQ